MTPFQVRHVYFHERDENGRVQMREVGDTGGASDEERIKEGWRRRYFLTEEQIELKWAEFLQSEGYRARLEGKGSLAEAEIDRRVEAYLAELQRGR